MQFASVDGLTAQTSNDEAGGTMAEVYKILRPDKYLKEFIGRNVRADGRRFDECQVAVVHPDAISTADGSSIVVLGDTKVCCGIKAELTTPTAENPSSGFVVTNLELLPLCSSLFKSGPPGDLAQACNQLLADIFRDSECIDAHDLCIEKDKLVWVIYCDLVCLNFGGSVVDACMMALIAALKTVKLPTVKYNAQTENCDVNEDERTPLNLSNHPVVTTFSLFDSNVLLANPTHDEEQLCGGPLGGIYVAWNKKNTNDGDVETLLGVHQLGGHPLPESELHKAIDVSKKRSSKIRELITKSLQTYNKK